MRNTYATIVCIALLAALPLGAFAEETYKVRKGDSLSRIAKKFHVKAEAIAEANGLKSDRLKPGDRLSIPVRNNAPLAVCATGERHASDGKAAAGDHSLETSLHSVGKGETLTSIADMYGMSVKELKSLNRIRNARRLKVGSQVKVFKPAAPEPEAAAAAPVPEPEKAEPPAEESRVSMLARELKELANSSIHSPIVKEVRELSEPAAGSGVEAVRDKLTAIARKMLDIPYRFGGNSFLGIDCSGYVQKVFGLFDIVLPRTAREQFRLGQKVEREELSKGDLVFFRTYAKFPSHVGIYLGDNRFIHASSKDRKVTIDSLDTPYYYRRFIGARRLPLNETADEI